MDELEDLPPEGDEGDIAAPEEQQDTQPEPPPSIEDIASEMGWKPQEQWRGDPDKWRPATDFVRNTANVNRNLVDKVKGFEDQLVRMTRAQEMVLERTRQQERERLMAEREEAWNVGDKSRFDKVAEQLGELEAPVAPPVPQVSPGLEEFKQRNPWHEVDREATAWAVARGAELAAKGIGEKRQFDIVEREARQLFPDLYPQERPPARGVPLTSPGARGGKPAAKGYAALPANAKAAADYFASKGVDREEYARTYFSEQEA